MVRGRPGSNMRSGTGPFEVAPLALAVVWANVTSMFAAAVADRAISISPCLGVTLPTRSPPGTTSRPKSKYTCSPPTSVSVIRSDLHRRWMRLPWWRNHGPRRERLELRRIRDHGIPATARLCVTGQKPYLGPPKTKSSYRTVKAPAVTMTALKRRFESTRRSRLRSGTAPTPTSVSIISELPASSSCSGRRADSPRDLGAHLAARRSSCQHRRARACTASATTSLPGSSTRAQASSGCNSPSSPPRPRSRSTPTLAVAEHPTRKPARSWPLPSAMCPGCAFRLQRVDEATGRCAVRPLSSVVHELDPRSRSPPRWDESAGPPAGRPGSCWRRAARRPGSGP